MVWKRTGAPLSSLSALGRPSSTAAPTLKVRSTPFAFASSNLRLLSKPGSRSCHGVAAPTGDPSLGLLECSVGEESSILEEGLAANPAAMWQQQQQQQSEWRNANHPFWQQYQRQQQYQQQQQQWRNQNQSWHDFPREFPQAPLNSPRYIGDGTRRTSQGPGTGARAAFQPNRSWNQRDNRNWQGGRFVRQDDTRRWLHSKAQPSSFRERFMFLSYNILAADNAREHYRELYYHIPMRYVKWDWRKVRLVQEIEYWSPDILCLQEVDRFADLQGELVKRGYAGTFKRRTGTATDGCAIFWREKRFLLLEEESIDFKDYGLRDNIGQICVLRSTREAALEGDVSSIENQVLVVANTHILFNPKRGDIKLGQVRTLLNTAQELSSSWGGAQVIVAGDFNSTPSSPLYRYISTAELDVSSLDRRSISGQIADGEGGYYRNPFSKPWIRGHNPSSAGFSRINVETTSVRNEDGMTIEEVATLGIATATVAAQEEEDEANAEKLPASSSSEPMVIKTVTDNLVVQKSFEAAEEEVLKTSSKEVHFEEPWDTEEGTPTQEKGLEDDETNSPDRVELPSGWTVEELVNATGTSSSTKVVHDLKLSSAYSEIEGKAGSRDSQGEPLATTYHKKFKGTVDYIWHTERLRPLRVVDMLSVDVLRHTGGLPSQKWGSDHLALVCEMEFS
ncbi:carbon catabolite repressor protein 4 homolog 6 [Selaginella moellendorffii]|uniref:carbon catabolite repressor protein 4 homolog 6 n=1 Tax=Selaginella moellendorffii TaxID=88036 RepID=UPI000D1C9F25|nr:carbon catabolite repressor protein 4 homolog 6 [Selaginella moellendorffii]|eukprot:XP_024536732.1 carbon catabolite repressor protein 4 homolog 6 [Selaginella moellendorffii]